jgi:hypothetical protein
VPGWAVLPALVVLAVAALIAVAGLARLGRGLTASPLPAPAAQLRTTHVYACLRQPIYSALLLGGAAFVVLGGASKPDLVLGRPARAPADQDAGRGDRTRRQVRRVPGVYESHAAAGAEPLALPGIVAAVGRALR